MPKRNSHAEYSGEDNGFLEVVSEKMANKSFMTLVKGGVYIHVS